MKVFIKRYGFPLLLFVFLILGGWYYPCLSFQKRIEGLAALITILGASYSFYKYCGLFSVEKKKCSLNEIISECTAISNEITTCFETIKTVVDNDKKYELLKSTREETSGKINKFYNSYSNNLTVKYTSISSILKSLEIVKHILLPKDAKVKKSIEEGREIKQSRTNGISKKLRKRLNKYYKRYEVGVIEDLKSIKEKIDEMKKEMNELLGKYQDKT